MAKNQLVMHITEDHNEVLDPIYRAIGSKKLSFSNNTMLHFDSHPDMLIPSNLLADDVFDRNEVERLTSIENWIMPLVYAGHISTVVWIKKEWAEQIADGQYKFTVGKDIKTGCIRCSCREPYFVSELLYSPDDQLSNAKDLMLIVLTYHSVENSLNSITNMLESLDKQGDIILDIDLDYFSTINPFSEMYSSKQLDLLSSLYKFTEEPTADESTAKRSHQLDYLRTTMKLVVEKRIASTSREDNSTGADDDHRIALMESLVDEQVRQHGTADAELLHEHGCTFDTTGLPHHISSIPQIDLYIADTIQLLSSLKIQPKIITSSRSSEDDYCPKSQVDIIEEKTIAALRTLYNDLVLKKHYLD